MEQSRQPGVVFGAIAVGAALLTSAITLPAARADGVTAGAARRAVPSNTNTSAAASPGPASPAGAGTGPAITPNPPAGDAWAAARKVLQGVTPLVGTLIPPSHPRTIEVGPVIEPPVTLDVMHPVAAGRAALRAALIATPSHVPGTEYFIANDPPGQIRTQILSNEVDVDLAIQRQPKRVYFVTCGLTADQYGKAPTAIVRAAEWTLMPSAVVPKNGYIEFTLPVAQTADTLDAVVTLTVSANQSSATFNLTGCQLTSFEPASRGGSAK